MFDHLDIYNKLDKNAGKIVTVILFAIFMFIGYHFTISVIMSDFGTECLNNKQSQTKTLWNQEMIGDFTHESTYDQVIVTYGSKKIELKNYNVSRIIGETVSSSAKEMAKGIWDGIFK